MNNCKILIITLIGVSCTIWYSSIFYIMISTIDVYNKYQLDDHVKSTIFNAIIMYIIQVIILLIAIISCILYIIGCCK